MFFAGIVLGIFLSKCCFGTHQIHLKTILVLKSDKHLAEYRYVFNCIVLVSNVLSSKWQIGFKCLIQVNLVIRGLLSANSLILNENIGLKCQISSQNASFYLPRITRPTCIVN